MARIATIKDPFNFNIYTGCGHCICYRTYQEQCCLCLARPPRQCKRRHYTGTPVTITWNGGNTRSCDNTSDTINTPESSHDHDEAKDEPTQRSRSS